MAPDHEPRLARATAWLPNRKFARTRALYGFAGLDDGAVSLDELVRRNVAYTYGYYARLARLHDPRFRERLYGRMRSRSLEPLRNAARERRGVVMLSVHLGDFDAAGAWLAETVGLTPVVTTAAIPSRLRQRFFDRARSSGGVVLRRGHDTRLTDLMRDLDRGRMVLVMLDRRTPGRSVPIDFLGRPLDAPVVAWWLARATGALLVPGATWHAADGAQILWCGKPASVAGDASLPEPCLQAAGDELACAVRSAPHQLHVPADAAQLSWRMQQSAAAADLRSPRLRPATVTPRSP
jgi:phosphatidylinositol dimannoside acyltransferase